LKNPGCRWLSPHGAAPGVFKYPAVEPLRSSQRSLPASSSSFLLLALHLWSSAPISMARPAPSRRPCELLARPWPSLGRALPAPPVRRVPARRGFLPARRSDCDLPCSCSPAPKPLLPLPVFLHASAQLGLPRARNPVAQPSRLLLPGTRYCARALLSWQRVLALGLSISLRLLAWIPPSRPSPSRPAPCCRELQLGFRQPPFSNPCAGPCRIVLVRSARRRLRQLSSFVVAPFAVEFRYPSRSSLLATTCRASASSLSLPCRLSSPSRFLAVVVFLVIPAASVVIKHVCCRELAPSVHSVSGPRFL
jgi:hypothetical protein